jgi:hypothetical protein
MPEAANNLPDGRINGIDIAAAEASDDFFINDLLFMI